MKKRLKKQYRIAFRVVLVVLALATLALGYYVWGEYTYRYGKVAQRDGVVQFYKNQSIEEAAQYLQSEGYIASAQELYEVAQGRDVDSIKAGNYKIVVDESHRSLLSKLANGHESSVRVTFNNIRTLPQLAGVLSKALMADSLTFLNYFNAEAQRDGGANFISYFIPNTYEAYWSETPEEFTARMKKEYNKFWESGTRAEDAKKLGYTPHQIITIASIVEEETNLKSEMDEIAGVYINRIRRGIPLQADPTVKFAVGDFTIKRVLNRHLKTPSPYNTYLNAGLPPGPICSPSIAAIDATLDYIRHPHKYIYFCANADFSGSHVFATTLGKHNANARAYHSALNKRGIR